MKAATTALCLLLASAQEPPPVTIHFLMWKPHQRAPWTAIVEAFESAHPGIRVRLSEGPHSSTEFHAMLVTKLRARDPELDAFLIDVVWPTELAAAGYLEPLDDLLPPDARRDYFPAVIEADTVDGRLMAAPFNIDAGLLYYRRDLLEEAGFEPPETWSRLLEQAAAIRARHPEIEGYTGQFDQYEGLVCNMLELVRGNGGRMVRGDQVDLDGRAEETIEWVRDRLLGGAAPRSVLNQREPESREVFLQGGCVFHRNWPETWNIANDPARSRVAGKVGLARLPRFEGGRHVAALGGWQLAVAAHSERKGAAREFVRFLSGFEAQKRLTLETAHGPSLIRVLDDPDVLARFPHFRELKAVLLAAEPRPRVAGYAAVSDRLQRELYRRIARSEGGVGCFPAVGAVTLLALVVIGLTRRGRASRR